MTNQNSEFTNNYEDTVATELSSAGTTLTVSDASSLAVPSFLVLDWDDPAKLEIVRVTAKAGNDLTVTRYLAGSAAGSGLTHLVGANVKQAVVAQMFEDLHDRVELHDHSGGTQGTAVTVDHGTATGLTDDDHTQYLKEKAQGGLASEIPVHTHASAAEAGQFDHGNAAGLADDDHTQYLNTARHDADDHSALVERVEFGAPPGDLAITTGTYRWYAPFNLTIQRVTASVGTAPVGGSVEVDVHRNGTTIFTTQTLRPIIAAGTNFDASGTPDGTVAMTKDTDYLTVDIDAVGDTTPGADLTVVVEFVRA